MVPVNRRERSFIFIGLGVQREAEELTGCGLANNQSSLARVDLVHRLLCHSMPPITVWLVYQTESLKPPCNSALYDRRRRIFECCSSSIYRARAAN